jgi:histidine triad (HIT) family protein
MKDDCIFCKIIGGKIPCYKIYEDENVLVFLDIAADYFGHTLVIPKKHYKNILDCPNKVLSDVMEVVQKISKHYVENCGFDGVNVINANEASAEQSVFHLHFHIIPRKQDDDFSLWVGENGKCVVPFDEQLERLK